MLERHRLRATRRRSSRSWRCGSERRPLMKMAEGAFGGLSGASSPARRRRRSWRTGLRPDHRHRRRPELPEKLVERLQTRQHSGMRSALGGQSGSVKGEQTQALPARVREPRVRRVRPLVQGWRATSDQGRSPRSPKCTPAACSVDLRHRRRPARHRLRRRFSAMNPSTATQTAAAAPHMWDLRPCRRERARRRAPSRAKTPARHARSAPPTPLRLRPHLRRSRVEAAEARAARIPPRPRP